MLDAPLRDLVAAVEKEEQAENMDEDDDLDEEDLPLALRAPQPAGGALLVQPTHSAGAQTGGISSAGQVVVTDRNSNLDADMIIKHMKVSLPLLKVADADPTLMCLLLNHLLSTCAKKGVTMDVPQGAKVEKSPLQLYVQKHRILAESHGVTSAAPSRPLGLTGLGICAHSVGRPR